MSPNGRPNSRNAPQWAREGLARRFRTTKGKFIQKLPQLPQFARFLPQMGGPKLPVTRQLFPARDQSGRPCARKPPDSAQKPGQSARSALTIVSGPAASRRAGPPCRNRVQSRHIWPRFIHRRAPMAGRHGYWPRRSGDRRSRIARDMTRRATRGPDCGGIPKCPDRCRRSAAGFGFQFKSLMARVAE